MARKLAPRQGELLASFLARLLNTRDLSVNEAARLIATMDGKTPASWQRTLRRWKSGATGGKIEPENADQAGEALDADFTTYVDRAPPVRDLLEEILQRIESVERRLSALEHP